MSYSQEESVCPICGKTLSEQFDICLECLRKYDVDEDDEYIDNRTVRIKNKQRQVFKRQ